MKEIVGFAISLAYRAGHIIREAFTKQNYDVEKKRDKTLVTSVDLEVEEFIRGEIAKVYPSHSFYGEETEKERTQYTWFVDPIDGTSNFVKRIPFFSTAIAFESPSLSFGVVYSPIMDFLFYSDGSNSYLNNKLLKRKEEISLEKAELGICHSKRREDIEKMISLFSKLKREAYEIRKYGSTSMEMSYVASSFLDGFIGVNLPLWDFKASYHIAKSAGLFVDEIEINDTRYLITSPFSLKEKLIEKIKEI